MALSDFPDLTPLLSPGSVAVVGASQDVRGWGYGARLVSNILNGGFPPDRLFLVNPKYDRIGDLPCYKSLTAVPGPVDLVLIILARRWVRPVLEECAAKGAKAAVVVSAGFAEAGQDGREEQEAIRKLAADSGLLVVGPNSLGLALPRERAMLNAYMELPLKPGRIGLVSQSGAMAYASILSPALDRDIHFSHVVSTGNEAGLESIDFINHFAKDPETRAICCFLEGFKRARRFPAVAQAALEAGKPILAVKVGRSELGARQAVSHTGALTGSDAVYQAVFDQTGVIRVDYPDDLYEEANLFAQAPQPGSDGLAVVSTSGGLGSLLADMCAVSGLSLPPLSEKTSSYIKAQDYLLVYGEPINPLDIRGQGATHLPEILQPFVEDDRYGVLVAALGLSAVGPLSREVAESLVDYRARIDKPLVVLWVGKKLDDQGGFSDEDGFRILERNHLPVFYSPEKLVRALGNFIGFHRFRRHWLEERGQAAADLPGIDAAGARAFLAGRDGVLDEVDSRRLLEFYGLPVPREALAEDLEAALAAAGEIGYPAALKVVSPDLPHKTEAGAIRLGLTGPAELKAAWAEVMDSVRSRAAGAAVRGVLVQEMVRGREMMVGLSQDDQFGPMVACGLGGVFVEVLKDVSLGRPPLSPAQAGRMLARLKGARLLEAFRGQAPADVEALKEVIVRVARLALDLEDRVAELDINPLMVRERGAGAAAVDALVRLKPR